MKKLVILACLILAKTPGFAGISPVTLPANPDLLSDTADAKNIDAKDVDGVCLRDDSSSLGVCVEDGGQVGVGTTSPTADLDIIGTTDSDQYTEGGSNTLSNDVSGNAATATALAADPADCSANESAQGVAASGAAAGCKETVDRTGDTMSGDLAVNASLTVQADTFTVTGGRVGIGTSEPGESLSIVEDDGKNPIIRLIDYDSFPVPAVIFRSVEGTEASSSAVVTNDFTGLLGFSGWNGVEFPAVAPAALAGRASENWSASAQGSRLEFGTTANGATTRTERMRIDQNCFVGIGTTSPAYVLDAQGDVRSTGTVIASKIQGDLSESSNYTASNSTRVVGTQNANSTTYVHLGTTTVTLRGGGRPVMFWISMLVLNDSAGDRFVDASITMDGVEIAVIDDIDVQKASGEQSFDRHSYTTALPAGLHDFSVRVRSDGTGTPQTVREFRLTVMEF